MADRFFLLYTRAASPAAGYNAGNMQAASLAAANSAQGGRAVVQYIGVGDFCQLEPIPA